MAILQKEFFLKKWMHLKFTESMGGTFVQKIYLSDFLSYLYKQQVFFQIYLAYIKCKPNFSKIAIKNTCKQKIWLNGNTKLSSSGSDS